MLCSGFNFCQLQPQVLNRLQTVITTFLNWTANKSQRDKGIGMSYMCKHFPQKDFISFLMGNKQKNVVIFCKYSSKFY